MLSCSARSPCSLSPLKKTKLSFHENPHDIFDGDKNFARQLSIQHFYWLDAKFNNKYFMKGITKPEKFAKMLKFFEITGNDEGLIKLKNRIGERLLEYNLFTYITLNYSSKLYNKTYN